MKVNVIVFVYQTWPTLTSHENDSTSDFKTYHFSSQYQSVVKETGDENNEIHQSAVIVLMSRLSSQNKL